MLLHVNDPFGASQIRALLFWFKESNFLNNVHGVNNSHKQAVGASSLTLMMSVAKINQSLK